MIPSGSQPSQTGASTARRIPAVANVIVGGLVYLGAYLTFAPVFKAARRAALQVLSSTLSRIKLLKPVIRLILAYETTLLRALEPKSGEITHQPAGVSRETSEAGAT